MSSPRPFVNPATADLDTAQILSEAIPLGKLIGLFVVISLAPFVLAVLTAGNSFLNGFLMIIGQIILAIGSGVVLMYIIARGTDLAKAGTE